MDKHTKMKINKCLISIQKGDNESLDLLYKLTAHSIRYIALKYLKNQQEAEDLEQDFWADIYNIADKFTYFKNGFSYLTKIMTHMAINRYYKLNGDYKHTVNYVDFSAIEHFDEDEVIEKMDIVANVHKALEKLDTNEKVIMQMIIYEDKSILQMAKELNMSKSKIGRIKVNAEEKLKTELESMMMGKK